MLQNEYRWLQENIGVVLPSPEHQLQCFEHLQRRTLEAPVRRVGCKVCNPLKKE